MSLFAPILCDYGIIPMPQQLPVGSELSRYRGFAITLGHNTVL